MPTLCRNLQNMFTTWEPSSVRSHRFHANKELEFINFVLISLNMSLYIIYDIIVTVCSYFIIKSCNWSKSSRSTSSVLQFQFFFIWFLLDIKLYMINCGKKNITIYKRRRSYLVQWAIFFSSNYIKIHITLFI